MTSKLLSNINKKSSSLWDRWKNFVIYFSEPEMFVFDQRGDNNLFVAKTTIYNDCIAIVKPNTFTPQFFHLNIRKLPLILSVITICHLIHAFCMSSMVYELKNDCYDVWSWYFLRPTIPHKGPLVGAQTTNSGWLYQVFTWQTYLFDLPWILIWDEYVIRLRSNRA